MQIIAVVTKDPAILPQASEELILESKTNMNLYPDSPGGSNSQGGCSNSLGSRKSSVCSISSINSSSSGSPGHQFQRSLSQVWKPPDVPCYDRMVLEVTCSDFGALVLVYCVKLLIFMLLFLFSVI